MSQEDLFDFAYSNKKKRTRKEKFLGEMEKVLPWKKLLKPVLKVYPKAGNGRPPIDCLVMLRIYFMQNWYNLSDPAMEDSLYDISSMRRFAGVDLDHIPDETTICKFRHLLERNDIPKKLFEITQRFLSEKDLVLSEGTIVDATIINAPSSTKNSGKKRDPEMKQTKKGNNWYFGMKIHVGTDTNGTPHSVAVTDASVHDSKILPDLLHGEEKEIYGDKAYSDSTKKTEFEDKGKVWRVNRKASRSRQLNCADDQFNKKNNRTRAKVEHVFGVIKNLWHYRKVRYKGLSKNANHCFTLISLACIYMNRQKLKVTCE